MNDTILSNLHTDIIRTVIRMDEESIDCMRLISKSWNSIVQTHLNTRAHLIPLKEVRMKRNFKTGQMFINISVCKNHAFRLAKYIPNWQQHSRRNTLINFSRTLEFETKYYEEPVKNRRTLRSLLVGNRVSFAENFQRISPTDCTQKVEEIEKNLRCLRQIFLNCSEIDQLNLRYFTVFNLKDITKTLRNIPVNKLILRFGLLDEERRTCLSNILRWLNTPYCFMHVTYCTRRNLQKFLLDISKHLLIFEVLQDFYDHRFYGIPSQFWHFVSRQMLANGLHQFIFRAGQIVMIHRQRPEDSMAVTDVKMASPDYSNLPVRERVFARMCHYGAMRHYGNLGDWLHPFFNDLFACQNDPESAPITRDNLTEEETQVIKDYFAIFLSNFMRSDFTNFKSAEREFLSGLVSFRIDLFPVCMAIAYPEDPEEDPEDRCAEHEFLFPFLLRINKWERHFKQQIINGYSNGNFKEINPQYASLVTSEFRANHKWWNEDYCEYDDLIRVDNIHNLLGEYLPNTEPYSIYTIP